MTTQHVLAKLGNVWPNLAMCTLFFPSPSPSCPLYHHYHCQLCYTQVSTWFFFLPMNAHASQTRVFQLWMAGSTTTITDTVTMRRKVSKRGKSAPGELQPRSAPHHPPHHLLTPPQCATSLMSLSSSTTPVSVATSALAPPSSSHLHHLCCHISVTPASMLATMLT